MKRGIKKFFILLLVLVLMAASYRVWLPLPARFLLIQDEIEKVDAIIVLTGDWNFDRENKAIELYKKGYGQYIVRMFESQEPYWFHFMKGLLNLEMTQHELYRSYFESRAIPSDALIVGEAVATSTFDELKAARAIILKNDFKSILLVTSDYHMRRTLMTANRLWGSKGVRIYHATAHSGLMKPDQWWLHEYDIESINHEYLCILYYVCHHFLFGVRD